MSECLSIKNRTLQMDKIRQSLIEKDRLLAVQEGLCGFLINQVIDPKGRHYYDRHRMIMSDH